MTRHLGPLVRSAALILILTAQAAWPQGAGGQGGGGQGGGDDAPPTVGVMTVTGQTVPVTVLLPGRAVAVQQTAIRPRVGGEVTEIAYRPGQTVEAGTVLFRLDDRMMAATFEAAESAVTSAEAAVRGAQATVDRYARLQGSGISKADLETAEVALANARSALSAARSQRELAQLELDHARIVSPIAGVADIPAVSVGDIVTATQAEALTTVTQLDPIYVDVSESRARILRHTERVNQGTMARAPAVQARLILETGQAYDGIGRMVTPGTAVSATTGTVPFRLEFANPDRLILPGQFVRVELTIGQVEAVLVPQRATRRSAAGALTAFVVRDGKAEEVALSEAGTRDNAWIVTRGVAPGDALVLDGLTNLKGGTVVTTVPVTIDGQGVVREMLQAAKPGDGNAAAGPAPPAPPASAFPAPASASAAPAPTPSPSPARAD